MNHSINDNHPGTSRATPKDIYPATWTQSAIKSDFEPSRHHRSASGYPSGPDYVSSSRRHAEIPIPGRDHKPRNVSESQPLSAPSHMRYRESHYADAVHPRPSHRKESTADSAAYASASKRHAYDSSAVRNNNLAEDVIQYPRMKYERWIPPNQPSPPSHPQEPHHRERDKHEREGEKDRQRAREEYYRERRDEHDAREKHKRRHNEGDSDWDKDRERKERREKDRQREWERERLKEQERERAKEDLERVRGVKERAKGTDRHRDEGEQERHPDRERQRAVEKEREKGRERERDRERRRQKERESGQDRKRDRKDPDNIRPKADLDRERKKERDLAHPEREHGHEVERGRESDREPLDRRKRKLDWESEKEREKVKEMSRRAADVPIVIHEGRRREVEHEGARKAQEIFRRDAVEGGPMPFVVREQDMDRPRSSKKDADSPRQRELQKVSEQPEADRARYTEKENLLRREQKFYEKSKRSAASRHYADRATDSEKENPSQRDFGLSNSHLRETVLRGSVEPEPRLLLVPPKQVRDERVSYASPLVYGATTRGTQAFSDIPRPTAVDGHPGHTLPTSRPTDPTLSVTPKYSPISIASAESQKMDIGTSDIKAKQGVSSQRALRRQSKMSSLVPEQIGALPPSHPTNKHGLSHGISSTRSDMVSQPPSSHAFRTDKEDVARLHSAQVPHDSPLHPSPTPPATLAKSDIKTGTHMHKITINNGSRSLVRNSTAIVPSASIGDRPILEISQVVPSVPRESPGGSKVLGAQMATLRSLNDGDIKQRADALSNKPQVNVIDIAMGAHLNDGDTKQRAGAPPYKSQVSMNDNVIGSHSANTAASGYVIPSSVMRNPVDKMGRHTSTPFDAPASLPLPHSIPPAFSSASNAIVKTSSRGVVKAPNGISSAVIEPVTMERNRVVPQPGLTTHLEAQQEPKRREPVADRVQNAFEIPVRKPLSAAAAGWPTAQGSMKETTPLETQQEQKRERAPVADSFNHTAAAAGWSTVQSATKEIAPLEMQQEPRRERAPVADKVYNTSEFPLRRPTSATGWTAPQGITRDPPPLEMQQEPKRERGLVLDSVQNVSEPPMLRPPSVALQGAKEMAQLETQQELKREKASVADRVQNLPEAPSRIPSSAAGWPTLHASAREVAHLEPQLEPKREKALAADRAPEAPSRRLSSAVGWPTLQGNIREATSVETQQESKREKMLVPNRVLNAPEVPLRIPPSASGWLPLQGSVKEETHLEMQLEPKREKVADRVQNAPEAPLRRPLSVVGSSTLQGSIKEATPSEAQREPKRERLPVVDNAPEVPSRLPPSTALQGNVREAAPLEKQEPKRGRELGVDRAQNSYEVPLRMPPFAVGWSTPQGSVREAAPLEKQEPKRGRELVVDKAQNSSEVPLRMPPSAGWSTAPSNPREAVVPSEVQQEPKRERVPMVDRAQNVLDVPSRRPPPAATPQVVIRETIVPLEVQQEPKRERAPMVDRAQNVLDIPSRRPPPAATPQVNIREAVVPLEVQQEPKREEAPMVDRAQNVLEVPSRRLPPAAGWATPQINIREVIVPLEVQQEPKKERAHMVDRAQNVLEVPSRRPPPAAGATPQVNIREAIVPLEVQQEPKKERVPIVSRAQNSLEVPLRRPTSVVGWSTSQGSTKDKVASTSNANTAEAPSYSIEQPTSTSVQLAGVPMASSVRTSFSVPRQEGLLPRVQIRTPIPENTSASAFNSQPPSIQPESFFHRGTPAPDRRSPPEPSTVPLTNLRSISEFTGTTLAPVTKAQLSKTPADEGARNGQAAGDSHPPSSATQDNVSLSLPGQRGDRDGFNLRSRDDPVHSESLQSHSPATSLRRDASIQPSLSKPVNVVEFLQNVPSRPLASNHSRSYSSTTTKVGEEPIIVTSHSSFSKPGEETNARAAHIPLGRHVGQPDIGTLSSNRIKGDRTSSVGQYIEQDIVMAPTRGAPVDDGTKIIPVDHSVPVISRDSGPKSTRHPRQTEHRHPPQTPLQQTTEAHIGDTLQRQIRDDKKSATQANNHFDAPSSQEEKVHYHRTNQASEDKKPTIQHEGLARILDQPLDRHVRKAGASPSTQSSHSGLPQEELQLPSNEVDRRHPNYGTPKTMPRSSSSMSHNTPSPVVKALSHISHGMNHKSNTNQDNIVQDAYNRPNISATGYPSPSSIYPTINSSSHISSEPSKNQAHALHTSSVHNHTNSYQSSTIEAGQTRNPPSYINPLTSHPPIPIKRPSADAIENNEALSSRYPGTQTKTGSHTDVTLSHQFRPSDVSSLSRTLDIPNGRAVLNEAVRPDPSSRAQESNPGVLPAASLLFSKSADSHGPSEHKGNVDTHISTSSHPSRGTGNLYNSSPSSQELERHEPRLITPKIQKHPELTDESRKKSHSLDVAKANPPDEVHKKSASVDVVKSKSHEQRPHEIWYPPNRDDHGDGKTRSQPSSVAGPVSNKGLPTALPTDDDQRKTSTKPQSSTKPQYVRHGRKSPNIANMKVYRYLREKRNRTISAVSMEAQDGTAPSTMVGSPTASVISQAPIHIPSPRDPMKAAQEWLTEGIEAAMLAEAQGRRRILRPGVVFDVGEDPPLDEQRHRSKPSRSRAQNRRPQS